VLRKEVVSYDLLLKDVIIPSFSTPKLDIITPESNFILFRVFLLFILHHS